MTEKQVNLIKKKAAVRNALAKINISFIFLLYYMLIFITNARSADLGAGYSKTSNGSVQKNYNLSFGLTPTFSIAMMGTNSMQETSDSSIDNKSNSYKGSVIYRPNSNLRFSLGIKKIDDYNEYEGLSYSGKLTVKYRPESTKEHSFGITKVSLGIQDDKMEYTKIQNETYEKMILSIGLSQVIGDFFTFGVDYSKNAYIVSGTNTTQAFRNKSITETNISDTINDLTDSSIGGFVEYNDLSFWALGISYNKSKNFVDNSEETKTYEVYADVDFTESITVSPSYSISRSPASSAPKSTSMALNINISY